MQNFHELEFGLENDHRMVETVPFFITCFTSKYWVLDVHLLYRY